MIRIIKTHDVLFHNIYGDVIKLPRHQFLFRDKIIKIRVRILIGRLFIIVGIERLINDVSFGGLVRASRCSRNTADGQGWGKRIEVEMTIVSGYLSF